MSNRATPSADATDQIPSRRGIINAAAAIAAILPATPLLPIGINGVQCWAKAEVLQPIGAFKIRGAWWRLSNLSEDQRRDGVVAVSSGNHAQGIAWAARKLGIAATIVMPSNAPRVKLEATKALGATLALYDREKEDRDSFAKAVLARKGGTLVHAFSDPWVIEGQGTAGLEIADQLGAEPPMILACCGGGGLSSGLALACPSSAIVPVEPISWDMVGQSLTADRLVQVSDNPPPTICDALQPTSTHQINLDILRGRASPGVTVSDDEVRAAQFFAFSHLRLTLEPGGAAALAAALSGKVDLVDGTVIMLTGGNVDPDAFGEMLLSAAAREI